VKSRTKGTTTNADVLGEPRLGLFQHRAWDFWFAPKRFESPRLYKRLGVLWIKHYVPTGGDVWPNRPARANGHQRSRMGAGVFLQVSPQALYTFARYPEREASQ